MNDLRFRSLLTTESSSMVDSVSSNSAVSQFALYCVLITSITSRTVIIMYSHFMNLLCTILSDVLLVPAV